MATRVWTTLLAATALLTAMPPAGAQQPPATKPATPSTQPAAPATKPAKGWASEADFYRDSVSYFRKLLADVYARSGAKDPAWDADAKAFLDKTAAFLALEEVRSFYHPADKPSAAELLKTGQALLDRGCGDMVVCYAISELLSAVGQDDQAYDMIVRADKTRQLSKLSECLGLRMTTRIVKMGRALDGSTGKMYAAIAAGPLDNAARRLRYRMVVDADKPVSWQASLIAGIDALPNRDPWLRDMLAGRLHIDMAWEARGRGFADTVTDEGWKGFFSNLKLARDCLVRAHTVAPEMADSCSQMIVVAMGGSDTLKEDPAKWFRLGLAAQPDYHHLYLNYLGSLLPRWGGTYDQMLAAGLEAIREPRYDTLAPWHFIMSVESVCRDMGRPWVLLQSPKVYDLVAQTFDGYAKACGPGRGNYFAAARVAIAIRAGKLDEARKVHEQWLAAGGLLDYTAFEYFGFDDGASDVSSVYAFTGPAKAQVSEMVKHLEGGDEAQALASARAAKAALPADDRGHAFVDSMIGLLGQAQRYRDGEWVTLSTDLKDWSTYEGVWRQNPGGGLVGKSNDFRQHKTMLYTGPLPIDAAEGFEVSAKVKPSGARSGAGAMGGIAIFAPGRTRYRGWVGLTLGKSTGTFSFSQDSVKFDTPETLDALITVRCKDHVLTAYVDGKQVGEPFPLPDRYRVEDLQIGVGGSSMMEVTFTDIRVRNLKKVTD